MRPVLALGIFAAAAVAAPAGPPASPPPPETAAVVAGLQRWLDGTSSLQARFRQSLVSSALGTETTESGTLYLERPGKLRWDYLDPERKVAMLLGDRTFLYLEADRQFIRGTLGQEQALFPRLLAGRGRVEDSFAAALVDPPAPGRSGYRLKLTPKAGSGGVSEVTLTLSRREFAIEAADVLDDAGNRTTYALSRVERNGRLPDGIFGFEPPPGTDVVDQP